MRSVRLPPIKGITLGKPLNDKPPDTNPAAFFILKIG